MGNVVNPMKMRLGFIRYWDDLWVLQNKNNMKYINYKDILVSNYISFFFAHNLLFTTFFWYNMKTCRKYNNIYYSFILYEFSLEEKLRNIKFFFFNIKKEIKKMRKIKKITKIKSYLINYFVLYKLLKLTLYNLKDLLLKNLIKINNLNTKIIFFCLPTNYYNPKLVAKFIKIKLSQRYSINQTVYPILKQYDKTFKKYRKIKGLKIQCSGRFSRKERKSYEWFLKGRLNLSSYKSNIEYAFEVVSLYNSVCGIKVWVMYKKKKKKSKYYWII